MNLALLDNNTGTVHLFHHRGRRLDASNKVAAYADAHAIRLANCDRMEFESLRFNLPRPIQRVCVVIDVKGGVAHLLRSVRGVEVKIVDRDRP